MEADLEKETARSHRMTGAARGECACTQTSKTNRTRLRERLRGSHGDGFDAGGEAELAKNTGGQVRVATSWQTDLTYRTTASSGDIGTRRDPDRGLRAAARDTGNTSNARLATVKVMEGRSEGQRAATGKSGG